MPELAERPIPQEEQSDLGAERPTNDELQRTAEQLSPRSTFDQLIEQEMKKFENLSDDEVKSLIVEKIREHGEVRVKLQEVADQMDNISSKVSALTNTNLGGAGSITPNTEGIARGYLSKLDVLGQKISDLSVKSEIIHNEAAAEKVAIGEAPNKETLTIAQVVEAAKTSDPEFRWSLERELVRSNVDRTGFLKDYPEIVEGAAFRKYGNSLSSAVKLVAKHLVYPHTHLLTNKLTSANVSKFLLKKMLDRK